MTANQYANHVPWQQLTTSSENLVLWYMANKGKIIISQTRVLAPFNDCSITTYRIPGRMNQWGCYFTPAPAHKKSG